MRIELLYLPASCWPVLLAAAAVSLCPDVAASCVQAGAYSQVEGSRHMRGPGQWGGYGPASDYGHSRGLAWGKAGVLQGGPLHAGGMAAAVASRFRAMSDAAAAFTWQPAFSVVSNDVSMHIRYFSARAPLGEVVQQLAHDIDAFQHMMALPAFVRLSGLADGGHWLAELEPSSDGSAGVSGRVSFMAPARPLLAQLVPNHARRIWPLSQGMWFLTQDLPLQVQGLLSLSPPLPHLPWFLSSRAQPGQASGPGDAGLLAWLPQEAVHIFSHTEPGLSRGMASHRGSRHAYRIAMQADVLAVCIAARLAAHGWTSGLQAPSLRRLQAWQRGQDRLLVYLRGSGDSTALYVHID